MLSVTARTLVYSSPSEWNSSWLRWALDTLSYILQDNSVTLFRKWSRWNSGRFEIIHYGDVIMGAIASQITSLTIVYSTVYSDADQRKHQNSASLAFVLGIHRWPVNSPHKGPVTRKMFPFDDVIMCSEGISTNKISYHVEHFGIMSWMNSPHKG